MDIFSHDTITQIINLPIIPVILLPATGLALLVFYNRISQVNMRIRLIQKELRDAEFSGHDHPRHKEMIENLKSEIKQLHCRTRKLSITIACLLLSILLFSLCALFAVLSIFYPGLLQIAMMFWFGGPVLICLGIIVALFELRQAHKTISMQTRLVEKWGERAHSGD